LQKTIDSFNKQYSSTIIERSSLDKGLSNTTFEILTKIFDLQDTYHSMYNEYLSKNSTLKSLFIKYNEKLRFFNKKNNKLKESLETIHIRSGLTYCNREENEEFKDIIRVTEKEIDFDRTVMKVKYNQHDLSKYEKDKQDRIGILVLNLILLIF